MTSVTTRRERQREELERDIRRVARVQLEEKGPSGVSWRGIAREVGMSPASLYTYFESLDALYTALITESFTSLADAVARSIAVVDERPVADRLMAGVCGYREWSLRHPGQFRLIYQSEIPGYEAPDDDPLRTQHLAASAHFLALLVEGWSTGELGAPPEGPPVDPDDMNDQFGLSLTADQARTAMGAWATFHGLTQLEVNGHIHDDWADPDQVYVAVMTTVMPGKEPAGADVPDLVRAMFDAEGVPRRDPFASC